MEQASTPASSCEDLSHILGKRITGQFLSSTPPVAKQILCHLGARDLNRCARVCKLWSEIAAAVKKRRHDILWMFQATLYPGIPDITGSKDDEHCTEDQTYICAVDDPMGIGNHFYEMLYHSRSQPECGIMFCSNRIVSKPRRYFSGWEDSSDEEDENVAAKSNDQSFFYHEPFMQYLRKELPINCRMICCGTPGIIGTPVDNSPPSEVKELTGFSACMLPNLPGLDVHVFSVAEEDGYNSRKRKKFDESEISRLTGIPENINVKSIILFCEEIPDRGGIVRAIVQHYLMKQEEKIALGGAIVDTVVAPMQNKEEWPMVAGMVFTGETVNAASIIIQPDVHTEEVLEQNLKDLKNSITMTSRSIAFMFACCGKGCNYYEESNVEARVFNKVFPDTLLFGCFSNGEIGITYLPNADPPKKKKFTPEKKTASKIGTPPKWVHGYTTIFVLISW